MRVTCMWVVTKGPTVMVTGAGAGGGEERDLLDSLLPASFRQYFNFIVRYVRVYY
jgi:hypothetical protein